VTADRLYWFAEPNDYEVSAEIRAPVSPRLDRVLVHVTGDGGLIRWVAHAHLDKAGLTATDAAERAWANLDLAVRQAQVTTGEIAAATVVMLAATESPSKASLLLAPALREVVEDVIGWPVLAVAPDRDFVILWNAGRRDLITGMGSVVCREYAPGVLPAVDGDIPDQRLTASHRDIRRHQQPSIQLARPPAARQRVSRVCRRKDDRAWQPQRLGCGTSHSRVLPTPPSLENRGELLGGLPGSDRVVGASPSVVPGAIAASGPSQCTQSRGC